MLSEAQLSVIKSLSSPKTYGAKVKTVEVYNTHLSVLFLAGDYVYKLKRAILTPDVDFSTYQKRKLACLQEMKRSTFYAPRLVVGLKTVRKLKNGRIVIGGKKGDEIDTVLVLKRVPEKYLLNRLLQSGDFERFEMMDLAENIVSLHSKSKVYKNKWGAGVIQKIILDQEAYMISSSLPGFSNEDINCWAKTCLENLRANEALISFRQKTGYVRKCHGDLLLSNIACMDKKFYFFSPISYDETLECVDTLYDLATLTMDLEVAGAKGLANILFNHYMAYMNDMEGVPLMTLYQSIQAMSRAVDFLKRQPFVNKSKQKSSLAQAKKYFKFACQSINCFNPVLIACGGLLGSGKSTIARAVAGQLDPAPGAVILQDDIVRKQILGLLPHQPMESAYLTPAFDKVVYDVLRQRARSALAAGSCVLIDALFYDAKERHSMELLAAEMHIPFIGLWMNAPLAVRQERIKSRANNPYDRTYEKGLDDYFKGQTGRISWYKIPTDMSMKDSIKKAVRHLKKKFSFTCSCGKHGAFCSIKRKG
ncbi:MAG: AAA family ATPase [Lactobacillales bacterium]|nr:AAA family ATPase [Lactobacillales bacterium]